jgi:riboflavin synthase
MTAFTDALLFTTCTSVFTGLVEDKGTLVSRAARGSGARLSIRSALGAGGEPFVLGESISVEGCCLTVVAATRDAFEADASAETLARTTLGALPLGAGLNLERAAKLGQRMGGHIVSGHVDGIARVVERRPLGEAIVLAFELPGSLARFVAEKGSVCVSGVSLTVNGVRGNVFDVAVIPHTRAVTTLDLLAPGAQVNVEVDVVARYVARILEAGDNKDASLLESLKRGGFV